MYLEIPLNYQKCFAYYTLTTSDGELFHAGIVQFKNLTLFRDVPWQPSDKYYLSIIQTDEDPMKLANHAVEDLKNRNAGKLQWNIIGAVQSFSRNNTKLGKAVECVETGEIWQSAVACADANNLSYTQLINHLRQRIGHKTVKGKRYQYV